MGNKITIETGIGKIENNYGTVSIGDKSTDKLEQVRADFSTIKHEMFKLLKISETFRNYEKDWSDFNYKEDFSKVYSLDRKLHGSLEKLYVDGRPCASEVGMLLSNINSSIADYPTLTSVVEALEIYWINEERINEYQNILEQFNKVKNSIHINLFSINAMQRLFQDQIKLLKQIQIIVRMLKNSVLYKKENHIKDNIIDADDAPEQIKTSIWLYSLIRQHPVKGFFIVVLLVFFYNSSTIYEYFKHDLNVRIFRTEATQEEKIKMKHIFQIGGIFVSLSYEMRDYKNVELSATRNALQKHFSALNFDGSKLFKETNINQMYWLKNYNDVKSSFEGYVDRSFAKHRSLYYAGLNLSVYINSGEKVYLEDFVEDWNKFQKNSNFVTPDFDTSKIKSTNDALYINLGIQKWLKK